MLICCHHTTLYETTKDIIIPFLGVISTIIIGTVIAFSVKNKEIAIYRKNMINNKRINIEETLYLMLEKMTLYTTPDRNTDFLNDIQTSERYIIINRLYLSKDIQKIANELLDYFKFVIPDYKNKDYALEMKLFDAYTKSFHK